MLPDSVVTWYEVAAVEPAAAYCTDQPVRSTAAEDVLRSSTKSLVNVAPALPPPPYTWLIATSADAAEAGGPATASTPIPSRTDAVSATMRGVTGRTGHY